MQRAVKTMQRKRLAPTQQSKSRAILLELASSFNLQDHWILTTGNDVSRYRPPRPRGSNYITPEGERALREELKQLWKVERPTVTAAVHEAAKNGDRSENGDYIYGKKRLREIDSRVRFLGKRLEELQVVEAIPEQRDTVFFGAWVELEDEQGEQLHYRIVGPDEFNLSEGKLSMDAPLARALLGKKIDTEIAFESPSGRVFYTITSIRYESHNI